jgi:hypothetical protein
MKMLALRRNRRFGRFYEYFEDALLVERVDELHRRHAMLRLDDAPADTGDPATLK